MSVRAPMQWSGGRNGGFSSASPEQLRRPVVEGKRWGPAAINVARQRRDEDSFLNWMERLIRRRRETPEIAFGAWSAIALSQAPAFGLRYDWGERTVLVIHNLSAKACQTSFKVEHAAGWEGLIDLLGHGEFSLGKDGTVSLELEGYGCRWFRVQRAGDPIML